MGFYADVAVIENESGKIKEVPMYLWDNEKRKRFPRWKLIELRYSKEAAKEMEFTKDMADEDLYAWIVNHNLTPPALEKSSRVLLLSIIKKEIEKQIGIKAMRESRERKEQLKIDEYKEAIKVEHKSEELTKWHEALSKAKQIASAKGLEMPKSRKMDSLLEFIRDNK